jgi:hypothetical protein
MALEGGLVLGMLALIALAMRALPLTVAERAAAWQAASGTTQLNGTLSPARLGPNRVEIAFETGAQIEVSFLPVGGGATIARRLLSESSPGRYGAAGFVLARPGPWQMFVSVEQPGQAVRYFTVDWVARTDGGLWLTSETRPWAAAAIETVNVNGAAWLSGVALAVVGVWGWRAWRWMKARNSD